jgi:hypothetical protein
MLCKILIALVASLTRRAFKLGRIQWDQAWNVVAAQSATTKPNEERHAAAASTLQALSPIWATSEMVTNQTIRGIVWVMRIRDWLADPHRLKAELPATELPVVEVTPLEGERSAARRATRPSLCPVGTIAHVGGYTFERCQYPGDDEHKDVTYAAWRGKATGHYHCAELVS